MKAHKALLGAGIVVALASCMTLPGSISPAETLLTTGDALSVSIESVRHNVSSIHSNGKSFAPSDDDAAICEIKAVISNESSQDEEYRVLQGLELLVRDTEGNTRYTGWTKPFDVANFSLDSTAEAKVIDAQSQTKEVFYFVHKKGERPLALTFRRSAAAVFSRAEDPDYYLAHEALNRSKALESCLALTALGVEFDEISDMLSSAKVEADDANQQGITLLVQSILSGNDSVLDGVIEMGADLRAEIRVSFWPAAPIHVAVLAANRTAIDRLMAEGVRLESDTEGVDDPAVFAVRMNNLEAVMLLAELGVAVQDTKIPMNWSGSKPAIEYAEDRDYTALADFLRGLD
jgi:hypothetical protein